MGKRRGVVIACAALCATLSAAPASAAFPGTNGKILYIAPGPNASQNLTSLRTINPDGTDVDTVTDSFRNPDRVRVLGDAVRDQCGRVELRVLVRQRLLLGGLVGLVSR